MNEYREVRHIRGASLRNLCIKNNWYTCGEDCWAQYSKQMERFLERRA